MSDLEKIEQVMIEKGWRLPGQTEPPLHEAVGLMIDLLESYQKSQSELRLRLYKDHGVVT